MLWQSITNVVQGNVFSHLWYLYMLAGIYLILPIIRIFVENSTDKAFIYSLLVLFIFSSLLPSLNAYLGLKLEYFPINSIYLFYLILGFYVHHKNLKIRPLLIIIFTIAYILYVCVKIYVSSDFSLRYNNPIIVIGALSIFAIVRQNGSPNVKFSTLCDKLSLYCFGVYLIHPAFIIFAFKFLNFVPPHYPILLVLLLTGISTIILSFFFCFVVKKYRMISKFF
jgi:surface polysaccharide O-acyltransferase-like enzyme